MTSPAGWYARGASVTDVEQTGNELQFYAGESPVGDPVTLPAGTSGVATIVAGDGIDVDSTDPANPIVTATGGDGTVVSVVGGTDIDVDSTNPANPVVNFTGEYASSAQGALADSAVQPGDLAGVATSGAYGDLTGVPAIPDALAHLDTTVTGAQLNALKLKVDGVANGAEVNTVESLADLGVTATAAELNRLDGVTATTAELNYTDGVTSSIQTQLNGKQPLDADLTALAALSSPATKLAGIDAGAQPTSTALVDAAGAVMNSDTSTAPMGFVVDEDAMTSNSATKVPTQQSVRAYVLAQIAALIGAAPAELDTWIELVSAIQDNQDALEGINTALSGKQPLDATLTALAALSTAANKLVYADGSDSFATADLSAFARTLLDDANAVAARATLGVAISSDVQAYSANLAAFAIKAAPSGAVVGTTDTQTLSGKTFASPAFTGTPTGLTKSHVGLSNVDNTSDETRNLVVANTRTGSYTLVAGDAAGAVEMNVASANTVTVPPNSSVAFPVGTVVEVFALGGGQTTIVAGAGVTIRSGGGKLKLRDQYSAASLRKRATNEWVLMGDLVA